MSDAIVTTYPESEASASGAVVTSGSEPVVSQVVKPAEDIMTPMPVAEPVVEEAQVPEAPVVEEALPAKPEPAVEEAVAPVVEEPTKSKSSKK